MSHEKNAAHAHKWGEPWTDDLGIFILSNSQRLLLVDACTKNDEKILIENNDFLQIIKNMETFILNNGDVFFRLSTLSPKDVRFDECFGPQLKAKNVNHILKVFVNSLRILEDIECERDFAIILRKWNNEIDSKNEYRCYIFNRKCEAIISALDYKLACNNTKNLIEKYIEKNANLFPEDNVALDIAITEDNIYFIEFNSFDDELDMYNAYDLMSDGAKTVLNLPGRNW